MRVLLSTLNITNQRAADLKSKPLYIGALQDDKSPKSPITSENLKANFLVQNFTARIRPEKFKLFEYHDLISCPCCGETMNNFNPKRAAWLAKQISKKKGEELSKALLQNLNEFQPSKRGFAKIVAKEAKENPELEFSEILNKISPDYVERLRMKQVSVVIDMTNMMIRRYPNKEAGIEKWRYKQIRQIINSENEGDFRNKILIDLLLQFNRENGIDLAREELEPYFSRLPNSKKDVDAFVVKYKRRSSEEGVYRLIKNTKPTIEHILPYSTSKDNSFSNLLLMCTDCNNARGTIPYRNFLNEHPEMIQNVEKYLDDVIKVLRHPNTSNDVKSGFRNYIQQVRKTLRIASDGKLFMEKPKKSNKRGKTNFS